jgi:hypothetical protein
LRVHPFTGSHGACHFMATFTKKRKSMAQSKLSSTDDYESTSNTWKLVPKRTLLQHSLNCPGVVKIKARQLIANPGFRNQVVANGRASLSELTRYVLLLLVCHYTLIFAQTHVCYSFRYCIQKVECRRTGCLLPA